ncbi:hypothetical protein [Paenibacillus sp. N3.4]|uniref:hypothetical protein n=1 Tax=Paenibacillus sp. N3.4 TaxID=2603222 RepID=UPI0011C9E838|nr:hypothetical protein [Paenibacillus sp. N3.4]TXK76764.1 hypothetical protein FU659_24765 [Paenibacillus sp. N3.4]
MNLDLNGLRSRIDEDKLSGRFRRRAPALEVVSLEVTHPFRPRGRTPDLFAASDALSQMS